MITITEIQEVLEISYPTALALAKTSGEMVGGKWLVPAAIIREMLEDEQRHLSEKRARFDALQAVQS